MYRSMMEAIVKNSVEAVAFYQKAFDAPLVADYKNEDGSYVHAELDVYGQILAVMELQEDVVIGNNMMFCLHFGEGKEETVKRIYDTLKDGAEIISELGPCTYSPMEADLVDKFGIRWCIFA